jgi:hypothetical protein
MSKSCPTFRPRTDGSEAPRENPVDFAATLYVRPMAPTCFWWRGSLIRDHLRVSQGGAAGYCFPNVRRTRQCTVAAAIAFVALLGGVSRSGQFALQSAPANRIGRLPHVIRWAWERREDLRLIEPRKVGVAYLVS